eukprot:CAMPEP_0114619596 /NCGR_PEP_ID=MMETSP0168-20121206/8293_1 /TAXON_ID=95228 ORGANISM="Vannella sp., Strain DIVA3 517/6/12" /NCGR_SAMPLE_ID=MMETSP0168 /ASSEMBLY_ACC=CAM_ASM_000044 /LENGTH=91 /DNA_ID=CAMNT_0001830765 /DNA_START=320 /DNA_END=595 /DNA_ORIENTATION=-
MGTSLLALSRRPDSNMAEKWRLRRASTARWPYTRLPSSSKNTTSLNASELTSFPRSAAKVDGESSSFFVASATYSMSKSSKSLSPSEPKNT